MIASPATQAGWSLRSARARTLLPAVALIAAVFWSCAPPAESAVIDLDEGPAASAPRVSPERPDDPITGLLHETPIGRELEDELLDALRDAIGLVRDEESVRAAHRADSLMARIPTLADWRPLIRAELLGMAGDTAGVRGALDDLDPDTEFLERWGWGFHVDALLTAGDSARAVSVSRAAGAEFAAATHSAGAGAAARNRAGTIALALGDTAAAIESLTRALETGPDHPAGRSAARTLESIDGKSPDDRSLRERLDLGRALLASEHWGRAEALLGPLIDDPSTGEFLTATEWAELRLAMGRGHVERRQLSEARRLLAPLTGNEIPNEVAAPALFWTGRAALAGGDRNGAEDAFLALARRAPEDRLAEEGLLLLLDDAGGPSRAGRGARILEELLRAGVRSAPAELIAVRFGADHYLSGDYEAAAVTFSRYLEGSRRSAARQQASYWGALTQERLGDPHRARVYLEESWAEDPLSFYGVFAGERLGLPVLPADLDPGPTPVPGIETELANAMTRLRVHQIVPTSGSFNHELARLEDHFFRRGDAAYDFAERLIAEELPIQGVVLGREIRAREGEWNLRLLRIVYPFPYRESIVRESRARGLDPFFVAGLIRQESLFHPTIESSAGAVGLMQLLPSTAQEVARSQGLRYTRAQLGDPDYNLRLGTQFLATMVRRYDGRAEDALSAYNAGPGRINQWRQRPVYRDRDVFMEHIPFQETRHYVKVVQQNTRIYTALYGCPGFEACLGDSYQIARARSPFAGGVPGSSLAR
ncbi:MAG: hypothetical protein EA351_14765 [Gemmatimonadales bacterium]|nr:MAG: hypothetical protein EA351_14765 [Gemmatimonadales bacterium]